MVLEVAFAPTQSNRTLVAKFREMPSLRACKFKALSEEPDIRKVELLLMQGKMAYIWGDGRKHDESFFFTLDPRIKLKINIDQHRDDNPVERKLDTWVLESGTVGCIDFANHMRATEMTNTKILSLWPIHLERKSYELYVDRIASCEIAVTIDTDVLPAFPVSEEFMLPNGGTKLEEMLDVLMGSISDLVPKTYRLDIGGLVEEIPDFELLDPNLVRIPTKEETLEFVNMPSGATGPETKKVLNLVGSYVTMVYANVIEVFSRSVNESAALQELRQFPGHLPTHV